MNSTLKASKNSSNLSKDENKKSRRDFLEYLTLGFAGVGGAAFIWPFIDTMNPARDVLALSKIEVPIDGIEVGQSVTVVWRGKPVFIKHRTAIEIAEAGNEKMANLLDPEEDSVRAVRSEWLVVIGICTHLGCVPLGNEPGQEKGDYGGWFCPCHGSQYDVSGRVRKGPAPTNLEVPPYSFVNDNLISIG